MKFLSVIILVLCTNTFAQITQGGQSQEMIANLGNGFFKNPKFVPNRPQGSPYISDKFTDVRVEAISQVAKMRYNVYNDEFEFISPKNDTLILDKIADFGDLKVVLSNAKYKLVNYLNQDDKYQYGYLINLYEKSSYGVFKKETVLLSEGKIARTTLERDMPAQYSKSSDVYFLKNKDKIFEFPSNRKKLIKIYPDMKEVIETFVKENKIDFDKDTDKIKIIDLLATF